MAAAEAILERDVLPDWMVRTAIRRICASRLQDEGRGSAEAQAARHAALLARLRRSAIAERPDAANTQHYEVPAAVFALMLGPHLKYSCGWWPPGVTGLAQAEDAMLRLTMDRAEVARGQSILELGCGWGSLTLAMAAAYPTSRITALSNSASQREYILAQADARHLRNVQVHTADINDFVTAERFDRIVSVEMFEHVRNYGALFERLARWLADDGKLFVHIFAHTRYAYPFDARGASDWMARHFFTGGMMPSVRLLAEIQQSLAINAEWRLDGTHYQRTAEAWLENFDRRRPEVDAVLARIYGSAEVTRWRVRWRVFLMACAEMFGYAGGREWVVAHYRFARKG